VVPNPYPPAIFPQPYMVERTVISGQPSEYAGDYTDAVENMMDSDNLSWSAGLSFQVPIGNRAANADYKKTILSYEKQLSDLHNQQRQTLMNLINLIHDLKAADRSLLAAQRASDLQEQNLATEEKKYSLGLNTSYEVLQAQESYNESRSSEIGALIEYTKTVGRLARARKGYLTGGGISAPSLAGLPTSLPGAGAASGIDASALSGLGGSLPAGIDINQIMSMIP